MSSWWTTETKYPEPLAATQWSDCVDCTRGQSDRHIPCAWFILRSRLGLPAAVEPTGAMVRTP